MEGNIWKIVLGTGKKNIGIGQSQIPIEIGEEQIVNNMDFEE